MRAEDGLTDPAELKKKKKKKKKKSLRGQNSNCSFKPSDRREMTSFVLEDGRWRRGGLMAPAVEAATIRWRALAATLVFALLIQPSISIYCDEDDCYDLLG